MAKAMRQIRERLPLVDVVLEVLDARMPRASANADLAGLVAGKPRVILLNKADFADPRATRAWVAHFNAAGLTAIAVSAATGNGIPALLRAVRAHHAAVEARRRESGRLPRPPRALVVGTPNVGKSTLINRLVRGRRAATGSRPGVTRGQQWVRVGRDLELLDTPGVLMPRLDDEEAAMVLAGLGAIKDELIDPAEVAGRLLPRLWALAAGAIAEQFGLTALAPEPTANLEAVARSRSLLRPGGLPDLDRAGQLLLQALRTGKLGRLTLEWP